MVVNLSDWKDGRVVNSDERKGMENGLEERQEFPFCLVKLWGWELESRGGRNTGKTCIEEDAEFEELDCKIVA